MVLPGGGRARAGGADRGREGGGQTHVSCQAQGSQEVLYCPIRLLRRVRYAPRQFPVGLRVC
eukprot:3880754-Rhodomonas_salina.1